ncbi:MAG: shikimate dehydrogenase [Pseudomonadota bacterium]
MPNPLPDRYAVMGNPIAHSKSPRIHRLFADQTAQHLQYDAILVPVDGLAQAIAGFAQQSGKGLNITVPFKEQAWALATQRSPRAQRARAVNTLKFNGANLLFGDNTDGVGLVRDLAQNHGIALAGQRVLILGAGGAVRGVLAPLLEIGLRELTIANRTAAKAQALAQDFADMGVVQGGGFEALHGAYDVVINGTAASLQGEIPPLPLQCVAGAVSYDMMYGTQPTVFLHWAGQHGAAQAIDGLGMLVEQAAESFFVWRGIRPSTAPVIEILRRELSSAQKL